MSEINQKALQLLAEIHEKKGEIDLAIKEYFEANYPEEALRLIIKENNLELYFNSLIDKFDYAYLYNLSAKQDYSDGKIISKVNFELENLIYKKNLQLIEINENADYQQFKLSNLILKCILLTDKLNIDELESAIQKMDDVLSEQTEETERDFLKLLTLIGMTNISGNLENLSSIANLAFKVYSRDKEEFKSYATKILIVLSSLDDSISSDNKINFDNQLGVDDFNKLFFEILSSINFNNAKDKIYHLLSRPSDLKIIKTHLPVKSEKGLTILLSNLSLFSVELFVSTFLTFQLELINATTNNIKKGLLELTQNKVTQEVMDSYHKLMDLINNEFIKNLNQDFQILILLLLMRIAFLAENWEDFDYFKTLVGDNYDMNDFWEHVAEEKL